MCDLTNLGNISNLSNIVIYNLSFNRINILILLFGSVQKVGDKLNGKLLPNSNSADKWGF
jgi:hypothetical protein